MSTVFFGMPVACCPNIWLPAMRSLGGATLSGELRLLLVAVTLAVAALSSAGFLPTGCKAACRAMPASCWVAMWCSAATTRPGSLQAEARRLGFCRPRRR